MTEMYDENLILRPSVTYEIIDYTFQKETLNKEVNCYLFASNNLFLSNQDLSSILYGRFSPNEKIDYHPPVFCLRYFVVPKLLARLTYYIF
jgi:hypothetical protein